MIDEVSHPQSCVQAITAVTPVLRMLSIIFWKKVYLNFLIDPDICAEIPIDLPVTWKNVRCSVIIDPDMCVEIFIDLLVT